MKRLLILCVVVAALLGLLAVPAHSAPVLEDGVYIWAWDGNWFQMAAGEEVGAGLAGDPLPAGEPVWICAPWAAQTYGLVKSIGTGLVYGVTIDGEPVVDGFQESKALWHGPWPSEAAAGLGFNPKMGTKAYISAWLYPVEAGSGAHEVVVTETKTHPLTDLCIVDPENPNFHPIFYPAGSAAWDPWPLVLP